MQSIAQKNLFLQKDEILVFTIVTLMKLKIIMLSG